jgi:hypothetical protein
MDSSIIIKIVSLVAILYVLYFLYKNIKDYYSSRYIIIAEPVVSTKNLVVESGIVPIKTVNEGLSYSISIWTYISNWGYKSGKKKYILSRGGFELYLDENYNNLVLNVPTYSNTKPKNEIDAYLTDNNISNMIVYNNFPLQKWVNIVIVVSNRTVDLWLNGKLYKSRIFNNLVYENDSDNLEILKDGGYDGYISRTYYFNRSLGRKEIIDIFNEEPMASNFINKIWYRLMTYNITHIETDINKSTTSTSSSIPISTSSSPSIPAPPSMN